MTEEQERLHTLPHRLRCKYPCGPIQENGEPEFGWRDMSGRMSDVSLPTAVELEAAIEIERLRNENRVLRETLQRLDEVSNVASELWRRDVQSARELMQRALLNITGDDWREAMSQWCEANP